MGWCLEPSYSVWTFPSHSTPPSITLTVVSYPGFVSTQTNKTLFIPNLSHLSAWITAPTALTFLSVFVMSWIALGKLLGGTARVPPAKGFRVQQRSFCGSFSHKRYLTNQRPWPAGMALSDLPWALFWCEQQQSPQHTPGDPDSAQAPGEAAAHRAVFVQHQVHSNKGRSASCS